MITKRTYRIFLICLVALLLAVGIYIGFNLTNSKAYLQEEAAATVINKNDNTSSNVKIYYDSFDEKTDIELEYITYYTLCEEETKNANTVYGISLNELKEQELKKQEIEKTTYVVVQEEKNILVFKRQLDQYCPNHFQIKLEASAVVIYNLVSDSVKTLYKKTGISENEIRPDLLEQLAKGIRIDSKEELNEFMEDIES